RSSSPTSAWWMWTGSRWCRWSCEPRRGLGTLGPMNTSLPPAALSPILSRLAAANSAHARIYPGEPSDRQPVHTVYGGAHLFRRDSARRLGDLALASLREYAPDAVSFSAAVGLRGPASMASAVYERVVRKLGSEPVEDFRIDFEDGYGVRPDA